MDVARVGTMVADMAPAVPVTVAIALMLLVKAAVGIVRTANWVTTGVVFTAVGLIGNVGVTVRDKPDVIAVTVVVDGINGAVNTVD